MSGKIDGAKRLYIKGLDCFKKGKVNESLDLLRKCFKKDIYYLKKLFHDLDFHSLREMEEFNDLMIPEEEFKINEFIELRLIYSKTLIFICGDPFLTCQKVTLDIKSSSFEMYGNFKTIDDIIDHYKLNTLADSNIHISPLEEFWVHCSNMQAWAESNYSSRILTKNLSFPILKELADRGVRQFESLLRLEIIERLKLGGLRTLRFFIEDDENYLSYLNENEIFDSLIVIEESNLMREISHYNIIEYTLTTSVRDARRFQSLRTPNRLLFCVRDNHITEIEILISEDNYSVQYARVLCNLKDLKQLKSIYFYTSVSNKNSDGKEFIKKAFIKRLDNISDLSLEFLRITYIQQ